METITELLSQFDLTPSKDYYHVFGGEHIAAASAIERTYRTDPYDHRHFLPELEAGSRLFLALTSEQYRVGYACFKRAVASILKPEVIVEIGVGLGVSALAFMDGCPTAFYQGIDDDTDSSFPVRPTQFVSDQLAERKYKNQIVVANSQKLNRLPDCDFVHVDGCHNRAAVRHDFAIAWRSGPKWILCDDARDSEVAGGIFDALHQDLNRGSVEWAYFPDTWTGNILVRTDHRREK
jgi:hypothetical protein